MTIEQAGILIVAAGLVWALGRLSSYGGWIRRVERQGQEAIEGIKKEIANRDAAIVAVVDELVTRKLDAFQKDLPDKVGVVVVQRIGDALYEAKQNEQLVAIGQLLKTRSKP